MKYYVYLRKSEEDKKRQVLSIPSQRRELESVIASVKDAVIVKEFREERTAKVPGRPLFNEMMRGIERGEAHGIFAWAPNRLSRNRVDSGTICSLWSSKKLKDLKFKTHTFENTPSGRFMLDIFFAESTFYVDQLSQNIARTNREKAANGIWPSRAKRGYAWNPKTKQHDPDPEYFPIYKEIFQLMLTGAYTAPQLWRKANDEWGLRSRKTETGGGQPISRSELYRFLGDPYYAGLIVWKDEDGNPFTKVGIHEPMITLAEFDRIQWLLGRPGRPRPRKHAFAYTGLIRCGECGMAVTAENQTNRYGYQYVYYRCTKKRTDYRCNQPYIAWAALEEALAAFLRAVSLGDRWFRWILTRMEKKADSDGLTVRAKRASLVRGQDATKRQLANLMDLRLRELITDGEFAERRQGLVREDIRFQQELDGLAQNTEWLEPVRDIMEFSSRAVSLFTTGTDEMKRMIVEIVGSNLVLTDKILKIDARKPFRLWDETPSRVSVCAQGTDVRTLVIQKDEETWAAVENIRKLNELLEAEEAA